MTPTEIEANASRKLAEVAKKYREMVDEGLRHHRAACDIALKAARVWNMEQWLIVEAEYHKQMCDYLFKDSAR